MNDNDSVPRHLRIALANAQRAFEKDDLDALATVNEDLQGLVDAALAWGRRREDGQREREIRRLRAEAERLSQELAAADDVLMGLLRRTGQLSVDALAREVEELRKKLQQLTPLLQMSRHVLVTPILEPCGVSMCSTQDPSHPLRDVESLDFAARVDWLERALDGGVLLPAAFPGESPEHAIIRHERALSPMARQDLRTACVNLVRRFTAGAPAGDPRASALLRLVTAWKLVEVIPHLAALVSAEERFARISPLQQRAILSALLDLDAPLPAELWESLAARDGGRLGVYAFTALLARDPQRASRILPTLPNDEAVADVVHLVLRQRAKVEPADEEDK